jgi:hypothetical protein
MHRSGNPRIEYDLGDTAAVAQVHEDQPAVVATPVHPASQLDREAYMRLIQLATAMGLKQGGSPGESNFQSMIQKL